MGLAACAAGSNALPGMPPCARHDSLVPSCPRGFVSFCAAFRILLSTALVAWVVAAVSSAPARAAERAPIDVVVKTIDRDAAAGQLLSLDIQDGLLLRTSSGEPRPIPLADVVRITNLAPPPPRPTGDTILTLAGDDVLIGRVVDGPPHALTLETADAGILHIPLDTLARVVFAVPDSPNHRRALDWLQRHRNADEDLLLMINGDVLRGYLTAVGSDTVSFDSAGAEAVVSRARVLAVSVSPAGGGQTPVRFLIRLRESGRFGAADLQWSSGEVRVSFRHGTEATIAAERIGVVEVLGGRWQWLGALEPISFEHTPMLGLDWPYVVNRNVLRMPLAVAGESFTHGIGVHSRARLTYDLRGEYREFVTAFGLDDSAGFPADVSVAIVVDGKRRFDQTGVRAGRLFGPFRFDVTRATRMELLVDFGENGDIQDRFNWIEAALVR